MKKIAFLFPGQGAQYVGMGKDFFSNFKSAKETFEEADDVLSLKLSSLIFNDPENVLYKTENSQLAIFVVSSAILKVIEEQIKLKPFICAGLSLGEYSALFASHRINFRDNLMLIKKRSELMNYACEKKPGAMAAVLGLDASTIEEGLKDLDEVWIANYNCPGQIVISGSRVSVMKAIEVMKEKGASKVVLLDVQGAFHSPFMEVVKGKLKKRIDEVEFQNSGVELVMNVTGDFAKEEKVKELLVEQLVSGVKWEQGIRAMDKRGVDLYLEIGPGKSLSAMNRKIGVLGKIASIEKIDNLGEVVKCC